MSIPPFAAVITAAGTSSRFSGGQSKPDGYLFRKTIEKLKEILPEERRSCHLDITNLGPHQAALGAARLAYEKFF